MYKIVILEHMLRIKFMQKTPLTFKDLFVKQGNPLEVIFKNPFSIKYRI